MRHAVWVNQGDEAAQLRSAQWGPGEEVLPRGWTSMSPDEQREATANQGRAIEGHTLSEARALATSSGYVVRLVREDSTEFALTMDLNFRRINVEVEGGRVVATHVG